MRDNVVWRASRATLEKRGDEHEGWNQLKDGGGGGRKLMHLGN